MQFFSLLNNKYLDYFLREEQIWFTHSISETSLLQLYHVDEISSAFYYVVDWAQHHSQKSPNIIPKYNPQI